MSFRPAQHLSRCGAEMLGTYFLVFFGCGSVHVAVLTGDLQGLGQVALVWAIAITLAIYVVGGVSGAHINPAMTLAFALWGRFRWREVPGYILGQLLGAILASSTLFLLFGSFLHDKEEQKHVTRGQPGSEITAMCYGEYFPNPGILGGGTGPYVREAHDRLNSRISEPIACLAEWLGTLILALVVFALTDDRNVAAPLSRLAPVFIGLTIAALICVLAPLTQACFNPARDFGPRLFSCLAGWGSIALPGSQGSGFLTVYILSPILGAMTGGGVYTLWLRHQMPMDEERNHP